MHELFAHKLDARSTAPQRSSEQQHAQLDDTSIEQTAFFIQRKNRWINEIMAQVMPPRFWIFLDISFTCRKAWHHYYLFLMSDTASTYGADSTPLSVSVCSKLDEFVLEFEAPLHGAAWCQAMIDKTDGLGAATILVFIVTLSLCSHGSFHDRVV